MGRNSAGTYSSPTGQPVVSGTTISASTHNTLVGDLATEMTDSLSRSGKGGMLAPLRTTDGTVAAPTHSFTSETGSGLYRAGASDVRLSIAGTDRLKVTATGATVTGAATVTGNVTAAGLVSDALTAAAAGPVTVSGADADDASAVGVVLDNSVALTTTAARIASFRNAGVEKASIDKDGVASLAAIEVISGTAFIDFKDSAAEDYDVRLIKATGSNLAVVGSPLTVPTPVDATDAATKGYVDARPYQVLFQGGTQISDGNTSVSPVHNLGHTNYRVLVTPSGSTGTPTDGSWRVRSTSNGVNDVTITVEVAPGGGSSVLLAFALIATS